MKTLKLGNEGGAIAIVPEGNRIDRSYSTEKLYKLEDDRADAIGDTAKELGHVLGHSKDQYWSHTMPEALLSILDSYERVAAEAAAMALLTKRGWTVTPPADRKITES